MCFIAHWKSSNLIWFDLGQQSNDITVMKFHNVMIQYIKKFKWFPAVFIPLHRTIFVDIFAADFPLVSSIFCIILNIFYLSILGKDTYHWWNIFMHIVFFLHNNNVITNNYVHIFYYYSWNTKFFDEGIK